MVLQYALTKIHLIPCLPLQGPISLPGTPSSSQYVPLRLGHVDAVTGGMNLSLPLGPKLPGRIPLGFSWVFDSTSSPRMNATSGSSILTVKAGGILSPIVWPSPLASSPQVTAWINGQSHTFLKKSAPLAMYPTPAIVGWLSKRGMTDTSQLSLATVFPSSDGTRFFLVSRTSPSVMAILVNDEAIWTLDGGTHTYFTNLWGDKVSVTQTWMTNQWPYDALLWPLQPGAPLVGSPTQIIITNENKPVPHWIKMTIPSAFTTTVADLITIQVTNGLGLPTVSLTGYCRSTLRFHYQDMGVLDSTVHSELYQIVYDWVWDFHFLLDSMTVTPTDDTAPQTTSFQWTIRTCTAGSISDYPLLGITHPNGLSETFNYDAQSLLSANSFNPLDGTWFGFCAAEIGSDMPSGSDGGVSGVVFRGAGVDQRYAHRPHSPCNDRSRRHALHLFACRPHISGIELSDIDAE